MAADAHLIACHECDMLQREVPLPRGGVARCGRCGGELYRSRPHSLDLTLAFTMAAIVLFALANTFPIVGLNIQGQVIETSLFHAVRVLYDGGMKELSALVFATTMLLPALELFTMVYLLLPLRLGHAPPGFALVFRTHQAVRPWGMVEVFMLGVLVSIVKLAHMAPLVIGIALWSFGALMLLLAAATATFDQRELWARMGAAR